DVVDHRCAEIERGTHDFGPARVDGNRDVAQLADHRQDTAQLLLHGHRRGARAARFAADIEDMRAVLDQAVGVRDGRLRILEAAAVGKGIGRDVHHAHDQRTTEREGKPPALQLHAAGVGAVSPCAPPPSLLGLDGACEPEGFGGRGGLPDMMSAICSASRVSNSSSAAAIASTLSRFSSRSLRATPYCLSMMRRISESTFCMVASETFLCVWIERPRKISPSFSP